MVTAPAREAQNPAYRPAHRHTWYYGSASLNHPYKLGGNMSGTMRERPEGSKRWELRAYVGQDPETGKPRQVSRSFRGGKREARRQLDKLVSEVRAGHHIGTTATVGKLLDEWLGNLDRLGKARSTLETYRIHVRVHIRPALGAIRLDKLTAHHLDTYFATLANDKGLSAATIKLDHAIISGALSQAVDWGWLPTNPAKRARLSAVEQADTAALSVDQLRALYFAAADEDTDMAACIALAALTGCRRGELCGLKWSDVDWGRQCLKVDAHGSRARVVSTSPPLRAGRVERCSSAPRVSPSCAGTSTLRPTCSVGATRPGGCYRSTAGRRRCGPSRFRTT